MRNPRLFPWKLFLRFVGAQAVMLFIVALLAGMSMRNMAILIAALTAFSALLARPYFIPLGRLIRKARSGGDDVLGDSEPAGHPEYEWEELELALDRMRTDLRTKTAALAREREELEVLMAAIPDAIAAVDTETRLLFFNSRFALLFGENKGSGKPVLGEIFRSPEVLDSFKDALKNGRSEMTEVQLHTRTEQAARYYSVSVTPLRRQDGSVYSAVGIFHDVTQLKRAEKIRIDFVANVSHELRTPLTAIKGYTDTLSVDIRSGRFDSLERYVEVIQRNTDRLMTLIEDLLDLSSLESHEGQDLTKRPVSVKDVTSRVVAQLEPRRAQKSQRIEPRYATDYVHSDPRRLEQVLVNLIDNAIKYGPEGGNVGIVWEKTPRSVVLRVRDNGPGIPSEYQARLFERFFRIDKARSRELGGTGLGLAIVKHIMQRHGGSVKVRSDAGQGTEFVCEFPDGASVTA